MHRMVGDLKKVSLLLFMMNIFWTTVECQQLVDSCEVSLITVQFVQSCPKTKTEWEYEANKKGCHLIKQNCTSQENFKYHCVTNTFKNQTLNVCAPERPSLGYCPEFNFGGKLIQDNYAADCKQFQTNPCPSYFLSAEVYLYPKCFDIWKDEELSSPSPISMITTNPQDPKVTESVCNCDVLKCQSLPESDNTTQEIVLTVISCILLLIIIFIILLYIRLWSITKRKSKLTKESLPDENEASLLDGATLHIRDDDRNEKPNDFENIKSVGRIKNIKFASIQESEVAHQTEGNENIQLCNDCYTLETQLSKLKDELATTKMAKIKAEEECKTLRNMLKVQ